MRFDLPQERHWRLLSGYCDTGKMAFENLPLGVSSHVYAACTLNAVRCAGGVSVDDKRIRLEVVRLLMHVTRRSIQSLANEVGCTRTHLSLDAERQAHTEWMSSRCLDAIQFDTEEAQELVRWIYHKTHIDAVLWRFVTVPFRLRLRIA